MKAGPSSHRSARRVLRFAGLLATAAGLSILIFPVIRGHSTLQLISIATAYAGLLFLAAALMIGPFNVLRARSNPLSTYLRRDIGIVAAILAIVHTVFGLQVHFGGDFLQYFIRRSSTGGVSGIRLDAFGYANHFGLLATLIMLMLLAISNNLALRNLGPATWKAMQRWLYLAAVLVIVHGLLYHALEGREPAFVVCVLVVAVATMALQWLGFRRRTKPP